MPRARRSGLRCVVLLLLAAACVPAEQTTPTAGPQSSRPPAPVVRPLPPPVPEGPRRVGLLVPLAGPAASLGRDLLDAAQLALFEPTAADLVLLPRDTGGTAEGARAAAREVVAAGAELLIGPLFAASATAVAPIARERGLAVLSFSNDASVAASDLFVLGWRPEEQVERIVRHALGQGWRRLGLLAPDDGYGARAGAAWRRVLAGLGEPSAEAVGVYPASGDPTAAVRSFLGRHGATPGAPPGPPAFDALLLADGGLRLRQVAALLAFFDVDPALTRLLGTSLWAEDPAVLRDPALRGARLAGVDPEVEAAFRRRFAAAFGRPPQPRAALAHDATVLALAAGRAPGRLETASLLDPAGHLGALGPFRLRADGLAEHALAILELTGEGLRLVEPAPARLVVSRAGG
jgi:ABC-type branched-subunit amino acid transport system substrate-binding protein